MKTPHIITLESLGNTSAGGKANGLHRLIKLGLNVPAGFVIIDASEQTFPHNLDAAYLALGSSKVAVRSSAIGEDGDTASFAGQFDTLLNVDGIDALRDAIRQCVASLKHDRVQHYHSATQADIFVGTMCVVVQCMVDARAAGVLFTVDPVTARRDRLIIDAVQGLGESLVSGEASSDHYELSLDDTTAIQDLVSDIPVLSSSELQQLAQQARTASHTLQQPLDMEWALDKQGVLYWLQARPITTLPADLAELDTPVADNAVITTSNIAEMMPGAVCPLTFSFTLRAIEHGFQHMHCQVGVRQKITQEWSQTAMRNGHFYLNLTGMAVSSAWVLGMDHEQAGYSICGQFVPELTAPPKQNFFIRLRNGYRFIRYLQKSDVVIADFAQRLQRDFHFPLNAQNAQELYAHIDRAWHWNLEAEEVHVRSSSTSAVADGFLQGIITRGQIPTQEQMGELAKLMAGADGVESALLVAQIDKVIDLIAAQTDAKEKFGDTSDENALQWLRSNSAINLLFTDFLAQHGHRAYRELCVREQGWAENPLPLVRTMQAALAARFQPQQAVHQHIKADLSRYNAVVRWLLPKVHNGIRRRERTKSHLVFVTREFGKAYRQLGLLLMNDGHLNDADLVFFFTHDELRDFVKAPSAASAQHAVKRRQALDYQNRLRMPELCVGAPQPMAQLRNIIATDQLAGRAVSAGIVEGKCRVALSPADATHLQPGEILIAPITDVAWTPYFSLIAGLATDLGSSVSHGAVIAREYGLPAVVNLRDATRMFTTGERVRLDGNCGTLTKLPSTDSAQ